MTVKLVYTDHPWDPEKVAAIDKLKLFEGNLYKKSSKWDNVVVIDRWLLFGGGR